MSHKIPGNAPRIKLAIERATAPLLGKPLWKCVRAADLAAFHFGIRREVKDLHSNSVQVGEYALHVQCAWRITRADRIVVGGRDVYYPADLQVMKSPEDFDWDKGPNRRDQLLRLLFEGGRKEFVVLRIDVGEAGGLHIEMDDGVSLDVLPDNSLPDEHWRLFRPSIDEPHFVVIGPGVIEEDVTK